MIRSPRLSDIDHLARLRDDPLVVLPALGRPFPASIGGVATWIQSFNDGHTPTKLGWVLSNVSDEVIGFVQLDRIDWIARTAWFGIWIGSSYHGQGHGARATRQILQIGHDHFGLEQIRLEVHANNAAAITIYERCGLCIEARLVGAVRTAEGRDDLLIMRSASPALTNTFDPNFS